MRTIVCKALLLLAVMVGSGNFAGAQGMAVNGTSGTANASAMLDVSSTSKGMLIPRMSAAQRGAIASPATGLLVYQTDGTDGFYFFNGTAWTSLSGGGGVPSGAAGGDLAGVYPDPTISNNAVTSAKILDGAIVNGDISTTAGISYTKLTLGSSIKATDIDATAPTTGQVLSYDGTGLAWTTASSDGGATLELSAVKTSSQTLAAGGTAVAPVELIFDNIITAPTIGTFSGGVYTAGAAGVYMVCVNTGSTTGVNNAAFPWIYVGSSAVAFGSVFSNSNIPGPVAKGSLTAAVYLASGQTLTIKVSNQNSSTTSSMATDGSTAVRIIKL